MLEQARRWNEFRASLRNSGAPIGVNAAVVTGTVIFGTVGDTTRLEYTVIGDAVNAVAKIEDHNKVLMSRAIVPSESLELARAQGYSPTVGWVVRCGQSVTGLPGRLDVAVVL